MEQFGEVLMLDELFSLSNPLYKFVRLTAFIENVDFPKRICQIKHKNHSIIIDLSLVDISSLKSDGLCQVIGETRPGTSKVQDDYLFLL